MKKSKHSLMFKNATQSNKSQDSDV